MIAPLRRRHLVLTTVLGLVAVALVIAALLVRPEMPRMDELPEALRAEAAP